MRDGNCCHRCRCGQYSTEKSYELATWQDYVEWCNRLGYHTTWSRFNKTITIVEKNGKTHTFTTKKQVYLFLLGEDYE